jgi:hypothetical protein
MNIFKKLCMRFLASVTNGRLVMLRYKDTIDQSSLVTVAYNDGFDNWSCHYDTVTQVAFIRLLKDGKIDHSTEGGSLFEEWKFLE